MSRILLDQNVPRPLRTLLPGHEVKTAYQMGWGALANGALLNAAEAAGFTILVTCDQSIQYQQNLARRRIGLVVLSTNNWNVLRDHAEPLRRAISTAKPIGYAYIDCGQVPKRDRQP